MSMAHCGYRVCMTDFSPISVVELTTKVVAICILCDAYVYVQA